MSVKELDEVQGLLEHVLPDPLGYAQRLALQAMSRWGQSAAVAGVTGEGPAADSASGTVIPPGWVASDEPPVDTNLLLATALGACECWGLSSDCRACQGQGTAGWQRPDPELFEEFVKPAIARMSGSPADGDGRPGGAAVGSNGQSSSNRQGVDP